MQALSTMADHPHSSHPGPTDTPHASHGSELAAALEPALHDACEGRLSPVQWFRSTWQAGGAGTGYATFTHADGSRVDAVVKLPVGPNEYNWTTALSALTDPSRPPTGNSDRAPDPARTRASLPEPPGASPPCPTLRVYASGTSLGGYDLAWLVVERLTGHTLSHDFDEAAVCDLLEAAARWYAASARVRPVGAASPPPSPDWTTLIAKARDAVKHSGIAEAQRWNEAIKHVQRILPRLIDRWAARPINSWCHGDLHAGNAMRRQPGADAAARGSCVLIDLALVHPGHWVEDGVYLERLYWGRSELLHGIKPVSHLAKCRRDLGLHNPEDYTQLANIRRVLMAASAPAFLEHEGHPRYVHAALEIIEKLLPMVSK